MDDAPESRAFHLILNAVGSPLGTNSQILRDREPVNNIDFAWKLYESERDFIKHHENQRTNASSILTAISAALVVAVSSDVTDGWFKLVISLVLTLNGVFGAVFAGKLYELIQLHANRSYSYLEYVNEKFPEIDVSDVKKIVKERQKSKHPYFSSISLNKIWFRFHILVAILGLVITVVVAIDLLGYLPTAP